MKFNRDYGLYIAEKEDLKTFCEELIKIRDKKNKKIVGEFNNESVIVEFSDTVGTLMDKLKAEEAKEKKNPYKRKVHNKSYQNAAGYSDPTAFLAIQRLDRELAEKRRQRSGK